MPSKRLSGRRLAAIILGTLLLIGVGLAYQIRSAADRAWKSMEQKTRELIAVTDARLTTRAVLRGVPESGNAWEIYREALKLASALSDSERSKLYDFAGRSSREDRTAIENLLPTHRAAIPWVRRGTQRSDVTYPHAGELRPSWSVPAQGLVALMVCEARLAREQGRAKDAARLLIDTAQFATDIQRRGNLEYLMIGIAVIRWPLDELRLLVAERELAAAELEEIDRELDILDRDRLLAEDTHRFENLEFRRLAARSDEFLVAKSGPLRAWRYGFSSNLMIADAVARHDLLTEERIRLDRGPWSIALREDERILKQVKEGFNPLAPWVGVLGIQTIQGSIRFRLTQLRLLRAAVRCRRDGTLLEIDDPFGAKIRHEVAGSTVKFWSVGRDGVDERGVGDWNDGPSSAQDVVLEIER